MEIESALIIAVPEAEPLVKEWRERFDWSAAQGVPAHVTILYPFVPPDQLTPIVLDELREFFAQFAAFEFTLPHTHRFPTVLYLAPSPADVFQALTQAVVKRYPAYQPYGGAFSVSEVIPHLTIADRLEEAQLDRFERAFLDQQGAQLPLKSMAHEVLLIENSSGRWQTLAAFALSPRA